MMDYLFNERRETPAKAAEDALPDAPVRPDFMAPPSAPGQPANAPIPAAGATGILAKVNADSERRKTANKAAYNSLSTLKIIGHALGGLLHHSSGLTEQEMEVQTQKILAHYARQAKSLHEKLGLPEERFVYESVTGSLSKIISQHYRIAGDKALDMDWSDALASITKLDGTWAEEKTSDTFGSTEVRRSMMMMSALAPIVSAYQTFNYMHADSEAVFQRMGDLLWSSVDDALEQSTIVRQMSGEEREMLRRNLLMRAGDLLADSWISHIRETIAELREMATDERRYYSSHGYPLDKIEQTFLAQMELIRQTLSISLTVHTGMTDQSDDEQTPAEASPRQ